MYNYVKVRVIEVRVVSRLFGGRKHIIHLC